MECTLEKLKSRAHCRDYRVEEKAGDKESSVVDLVKTEGRWETLVGSVRVEEGT